jgi:hypothetical protein
VLGSSLLLTSLVGAGLLVVATGLVAPPDAPPAAPPAAPAATPAGRPVPAAERAEPAVAVVRPGDTLWSVAARHRPSRDAYGTIEEIRRLNGLHGHTVHPGQELLLPVRR